MNADEFIERVAEKHNLGPKDEWEGDWDPLSGALWFVSCHEAAAILDAWTVKDIAWSLREGTIGGPFLTREDLEKWIEEHEEMFGDAQDPWDWLDEALDRHFGIR